MGHLVSAPVITGEQLLTLEDCYQQLKAAHDYLVINGAIALQRALQIENLSYWGIQAKRILVALPHENRPKLISSDLDTHNLTEIYNQCATMERLLDALTWAIQALPNYHVMCCHPTTSSGRDENDLVLISSTGDYARFEVSDVASEKDGNRKEEKDLRHLGILETASTDSWPNGRLFLVVSEEFATKLRRKTKLGIHQISPYYYVEMSNSTSTCIFEVYPLAYKN
jgi:hypothetical protein